MYSCFATAQTSLSCFCCFFLKFFGRLFLGKKVHFFRQPVNFLNGYKSNSLRGISFFSLDFVPIDLVVLYTPDLFLYPFVSYCESYRVPNSKIVFFLSKVFFLRVKNCVTFWPFLIVQQASDTLVG